MNILQKTGNQLGVLGIIMGVIGSIVFLMMSHASRFQYAVSQVQIGKKIFVVELADTQATRELGLGNRDVLDFDHGMLFLFPEQIPDRHAFWMKDMRFPLDIAWIRSGQVVFVQRNIPSDSMDIFQPPVPADSVLEVNASALADVDRGDTVLMRE